jgi:hypothetical protein
MQGIIIEFLLVIPQADAVAADIGHGFGGIEEMFERLGGDVLVNMVGQCQLEGVEKLEDLQPGMVLDGIVTNVAAFGAFVDVGVH